MPFSSILDVAIGVAFVFLFFSLICSVVQEGIAAVLSMRAKNLVAGIESLFSQGEIKQGTSFVEAIYNHGLIRGLFKDPTKTQPVTASSGAEKVKQTFGAKILPSYIPSRTFAIALLDLLLPASAPATQTLRVALATGTPQTPPTAATSPPPATQPVLITSPAPPTAQSPGGPSAAAPPPARTLGSLYSSIQALPPSRAKDALLSLASNTQKDVAEFQERVENWYDDSMDRAAGWYKRKAQQILLGLGLLVAVTLNVDSINVARTLWADPVARQGTVTLADDYVHAHPVESPDATDAEKKAQAAKRVEEEAKQLKDIGQNLPIPFGWGVEARQSFSDAWANRLWLSMFGRLAGWLITAVALSLGAPFWFDTLNKFMMARASVKPKDKSAKKSG